MTFGLKDTLEWFILLIHSFEYTSTSAIAKDLVQKITETTTIQKLHEVAKTLKLGNVYDLNPSVDTKTELVKLQIQIK